MKITFQNWHSECTNSSDMFVFLFCFFLFSAFFFQFFLCFGGFVLSFESTYNGCWYTVTGPDVCIHYSKIHLYFVLYYRVCFRYIAASWLTGSFFGRTSSREMNPFQICLGGFKIESARLLHYQSVLYLILHVKLPFVLLGLHFQSSFSHFKAYVSFFFLFVSSISVFELTS